MRIFKWLWKYIGWGRLVALILLLGFLQFRASDNVFLQSMLLRTFDLYQWLKPREADQRPVVIIDIDERSIAKFGQWPWPRTRIAKLIENTRANGAKALAFDMVFSEPDRLNPPLLARQLPSLNSDARAALEQLPSNDNVMAQAIQNSRVVLGRSGAHHNTLTKDEGEWPQTPIATIGGSPKGLLLSYPNVLHNLPVLEQAATGRGLFSIAPDIGGTIRRVPLVQQTGDLIAPSLSVELLRVGTKTDTLIVKRNSLGVDQILVGQNASPTDRHGRFWVHFAKHDRSRYISAVDVINNNENAKQLAGKFVLVGTSAIGLFDLKATPVHPAMPGVEVHAQVIENVLTKSFLSRPANAVGGEVVLALIVGLLVIIFVPILGALRVLVLGAALAAALASLSWQAYLNYNVLIDIAYPLASSIAVFLALVFVNYFREETQRRQIRGAFGQYLAPAMVEQLAKDPSRLVLGGETRNLTLLFSDIRGFTSISETYLDNPQELTSLINRMLTPLSHAIIEARGTIDKYIGDAIVAFWNAPLEDKDHAANACSAALDMIERLNAFNEQRRTEAEIAGMPFVPLRIGIGVNSGNCVVGNIGSDLRFDYSVLGDTVNLCARLEDQSKTYGVPIIVGPATAEQLGDRFAFIEMDRIRVTGKQEATTIFTLVGDNETAQSTEFLNARQSWYDLLAAFRATDFSQAHAKLEQCRAAPDTFALTPLYDLYQSRLDQFAATPPGPDWDGVFNMEKH
ncbi:MAG: adenylate/guanylate cyclase domain-containing protein [Pseudomonadota bacterium]